MLDDDAKARASQVGQAIQTTVAAQPEIAASVMGMGLDALSGLLTSDPDQLLQFAPMLNLAVAAYNYVVTGEAAPELAQLMAGAYTFDA